MIQDQLKLAKTLRGRIEIDLRALQSSLQCSLVGLFVPWKSQMVVKGLKDL